MVTTTVQNILTAAYALSTKNKPGTIATESTELLEVVKRALRGIYSAAARIDNTFFAGVGEVTANAESGGPAGEGWERPQEAESIFRIERTRGTTGGVGDPNDEVVLVPYDDRKAEEGMGAVYRIGQAFFPAGNTPDPTGGELRFFFSRRPDDPESLASTLDSQWTEQFNDILIFDVGAYLARKDGREPEAAALLGEMGKCAARFVAFLEHKESNERRRFAHVRRINTNTLVSVMQLMGAGSTPPVA
jgi:hypothetical protein